VRRGDFEGKEGLSEQLNLVQTTALKVAKAKDDLTDDNAPEAATAAALAELEQGELVM
jgi:hypothetical protein